MTYKPLYTRLCDIAEKYNSGIEYPVVKDYFRLSKEIKNRAALKEVRRMYKSGLETTLRRYEK